MSLRTQINHDLTKFVAQKMEQAFLDAARLVSREDLGELAIHMTLGCVMEGSKILRNIYEEDTGEAVPSMRVAVGGMLNRILDFHENKMRYPDE